MGTQLIATAIDLCPVFFSLRDHSIFACVCRSANEAMLPSLGERLQSNIAKENGNRIRHINEYVANCIERKHADFFIDNYLSKVRVGDIIYDPGRTYTYKTHSVSTFFEINLVLLHKGWYLAGKCQPFPGFCSSVPRYILTPPRSDII